MGCQWAKGRASSNGVGGLWICLHSWQLTTGDGRCVRGIFDNLFNDNGTRRSSKCAQVRADIAWGGLGKRIEVKCAIELQLCTNHV